MDSLKIPSVVFNRIEHVFQRKALCFKFGKCPLGYEFKFRSLSVCYIIKCGESKWDLGLGGIGFDDILFSSPDGDGGSELNPVHIIFSDVIKLNALGVIWGHTVKGGGLWLRSIQGSVYIVRTNHNSLPDCLSVSLWHKRVIDFKLKCQIKRGKFRSLVALTLN